MRPSGGEQASSQQKGIWRQPRGPHPGTRCDSTGREAAPGPIRAAARDCVGTTERPSVGPIADRSHIGWSGECLATAENPGSIYLFWSGREDLNLRPPSPQLDPGRPKLYHSVPKGSKYVQVRKHLLPFCTTLSLLLPAQSQTNRRLGPPVARGVAVPTRASGRGWHRRHE